MARQLTDKQKAFLDLLFTDECRGSFVLAKKAAGYADGVSCTGIVESLKDEIIEKTKDFMVSKGPKAAFVFSDAMDNPVELGIKEKMQAAKEVLDRAGVVKTENLNISSNGIFILPPIEEGEEPYNG